MTAPLVPSWLRADGDAAALLDISAQPGAKRSELNGLHDGALRVRIAAPALDGRGNAALCAWLAARLGVAQRAVSVVRGEKSRRKLVRVDLPAAQVRERIEALLGAAEH